MATGYFGRIEERNDETEDLKNELAPKERVLNTNGSVVLDHEGQPEFYRFNGTDYPIDRSTEDEYYFTQISNTTISLSRVVGGWHAFIIHNLGATA